MKRYRSYREEQYLGGRKGGSMRIKPSAFGLSLGLLWGSTLFITTWLSHYTGYATDFLDVLAGSIYPGFSISPLGSFIGFGYGFLDLFIMGAAAGWLYNKFARV